MNHEELRTKYAEYVAAKSKNFTIYHCTGKTESGHHIGFMWEFPSRKEELRLADHYEMVALMQIESEDLSICDQLSRNFALTNHIESSWTENIQVQKLYSTRCRSTSVGDIIEDNETGEKYIVAGCGFRRLTNDCLNNITVDNTVEV